MIYCISESIYLIYVPECSYYTNKHLLPSRSCVVFDAGVSTYLTDQGSFLLWRKGSSRPGAMAVWALDRKCLAGSPGAGQGLALGRLLGFLLGM